MLDVLVARIASGFIRASVAAKIFCLSSEHLRHRLDDEVGVAHAFALEVGDEPVERVAHLGGLLSADLAVELGGAPDRGAERLGLHVGERSR